MLFWDVDTQLDFLIPSGRLYVPGAEKIIPNLRNLTAWAADRGVPIVSSACAHLPGDPELQIYGPHCMTGTPGQQKVPEALLPHRFVVPNRLVALPNLRPFQQVIIHKQAFDVFTNPNAEQVVRQFGTGLRIVMYGVTTDICVACAAQALLGRGHRVELMTDSIAALERGKAEAFLEDFARRGGKLVKTYDILAETRAA